MRIVAIIGLILMGFAVAAQTQEDIPLVAGKIEFAKSVQIFPNPAVDFVHVRIEHIPSQDIKLTLHNIIGNEMKVETEIVSENELRIRVKDLAVGYYFVAVKNEGEQFRGTFKFLKR